MLVDSASHYATLRLSLKMAKILIKFKLAICPNIDYQSFVLFCSPFPFSVNKSSNYLIPFNKRNLTAKQILGAKTHYHAHVYIMIMGRTLEIVICN